MDPGGIEARELRDYVAILRRRKMVVAVVILASALAALGSSLLQTPQYRSSADVLIRSSSVTGQVTFATATGLSAEVVFATRSEMKAALFDALGIAPDVDVTSNTDLSTLTFTAISDDPDDAALIANTYANLFIQRRSETRLTEYLNSTQAVSERLTTVEADIEELDATYLQNLNALPPGDDVARQTLEADYSADRSRLEAQRRRFLEVLDELSLSAQFIGLSGTQVISPATPPQSPFEPDIANNILTALVVALALGIGLAFFLDYFDDTIKTREDFDNVVRPLPTLAVIPRLLDWQNTGETHVATIEQPRSAAAEAYRSLRTSISFLSIGTPLKILQITSPKERDGKSTTSVNLAVASAIAGQRVLLVDVDLRRPRVHRFFSLPNRFGFDALLLEEASTAEVVRRVPGIPDLSVITAGPVRSNSTQLLDSGRAAQVLRELADLYDLVIVDCPPVLSVADPVVLSRAVDAVVVVAAAGSTHRSQLGATLSILAGVGAPVIGAVLNSFDARAAGYYGYGAGYGSGYGYGYGYVYGEDPKGRSSRRAKKETDEFESVLLASVPDHGPSQPRSSSVPQSRRQRRQERRAKKGDR
jgi:capsular exopolysaccharide synthesis family protein